jgi:esterase/lipase superfamily enzyme
MVGNWKVFFTDAVILVNCGQIVGIVEGHVGTQVLVFSSCGTFKTGSIDAFANRVIGADTVVVFVIDGLDAFVG